MPDDVFTFEAPLKLFPQKGGWYYVAAPRAMTEPLLGFADRGLVAIEVTVGDSAWPTSLLPMGDGTHFVAIPAQVRTRQKLALGDQVRLSFTLRER